MKKYFNYALASAIVLLSTNVFIACSSSDDLAVEDNPTYDPVAKTVTTQFVLNVAGGEMNATRQSATTVQRNANFRGMQDAKLIGLATGNSSYLAPFAGGATVTDWSAASGTKAKTYDLGTLYGATAVNNTDANNANNSSHRVLELTLPLTTDAMLVYARAIPSGTDEENGKVTANITANPENTTFDLVPRIANKKDSYDQTCNLTALIINQILKSEVAAASTYSHGVLNNVEALPAISWRGIGKTLKDGGSLPPLQENLAAVYNAFSELYISIMVLALGAFGLFFMVIIDKGFTVRDASFMFTLIMIVTVGFQSALYIRYLPCHYYVNVAGNEAHLFNLYTNLESSVLFLYVLIATFMTDIGAYFVGVFFGKHKMNPRISPKKTWEGFFGGVIISSLVSFAFGFVFSICKHPLVYGVLDFQHWYLILALSLIIPVASVLGDFVFSAAKRHFDIKDFGNIIPGHGGVLDRLDSAIFSLLAVASFLSLFEYWSQFVK